MTKSMGRNRGVSITFAMTAVGQWGEEFPPSCRRRSTSAHRPRPGRCIGSWRELLCQSTRQYAMPAG